MAVDLSTVDTLQAALTYHRERHTCSRETSPTWTHLATARSTWSAAPPAIRPSSRSPTRATFDDGGALRGSDGNAVSLEREPSKIDANRARCATAAALVSRRLAVLRYVAGDGT